MNMKHFLLLGMAGLTTGCMSNYPNQSHYSTWDSNLHHNYNEKHWRKHNDADYWAGRDVRDRRDNLENRDSRSRY